MNHKRRRPKSARAGCLLCKPHKANGAAKKLANQTMQEKRARVEAVSFLAAEETLAEIRYQVDAEDELSWYWPDPNEYLWEILQDDSDADYRADALIEACE